MSRINKQGKGKKEEAGVHDELKGLDLKINEFGQVLGNKTIEEINDFLNKHTSDKKLTDRSGSFGEIEDEEAKD